MWSVYKYAWTMQCSEFQILIGKIKWAHDDLQEILGSVAEILVLDKKFFRPFPESNFV